MNFEKYGQIYKITNNINGKVYIGQTINSLRVRLNGHYKVRKHTSLIHSSMRKYGKANFKIEALYTSFCRDDLNDKEVEFIQLFKSRAPDGYNLTDGGDGVINLDKHTIKKISNSVRAAYKNDPTYATRNAIAQGAKIFDVFNRHTNKYIGTWINKAQCARELNLKHSSVCRAVKGIYEYHKDYVFKIKGVE